MSDEDKALAYKLHLQKWSYVQIAARLEARQGDVIRIVAAAQRKQDALCAHCQWRKDGLEVCMLPGCMYGVGRPRTKRRRKLWIKKRF